MKVSSTRIGVTLLVITFVCGIIGYILTVATQASSAPPIVSFTLGIVAAFIIILTGLLGNQAATALQPSTDDTVGSIYGGPNVSGRASNSVSAYGCCLAPGMLMA